MIKLMLRCTTVAMLVALLAAAAAADDMFQPEWRGAEGSTFQAWDFLTDDNPASPESADNPYGAPMAAITPSAIATGWWDAYPPIEEGRLGVWDIGPGETDAGQMILTIPNNSVTGEGTYKDIWIQVTYYQDITDAPVIDIPGGSFVEGQTVVAEDMPSPWGAYQLELQKWRMEPNPFEEQIVITGCGNGSLIDQVVVDTVCVPEPASMGLLALGGLGILWRRRRG